MVQKILEMVEWAIIVGLNLIIKNEKIVKPFELKPTFDLVLTCLLLKMIKSTGITAEDRHDNCDICKVSKKTLVQGFRISFRNRDFG